MDSKAISSIHHRDLGNLVRREITDKTGKRTTVWVNPHHELPPEKPAKKQEEGVKKEKPKGNAEFRLISNVPYDVIKEEYEKIRGVHEEYKGNLHALNAQVIWECLLETRMSATSKNNAVFYSTDGKDLKGGISYDLKHDGKTLYIDFLGVHPDEALKPTRKGIGSALLIHAMREAYRKGADVELCSLHSSVPFYRKMGFKGSSDYMRISPKDLEKVLQEKGDIITDTEDYTEKSVSSKKKEKVKIDEGAWTRLFHRMRKEEEKCFPFVKKAKRVKNAAFVIDSDIEKAHKELRPVHRKYGKVFLQHFDIADDSFIEDLRRTDMKEYMRNLINADKGISSPQMLAKVARLHFNDPSITYKIVIRHINYFKRKGELTFGPGAVVKPTIEPPKVVPPPVIPKEPEVVPATPETPPPYGTRLEWDLDKTLMKQERARNGSVLSVKTDCSHVGTQEVVFAGTLLDNTFKYKWIDDSGKNIVELQNRYPEIRKCLRFNPISRIELHDSQIRSRRTIARSSLADGTYTRFEQDYSKNFMRLDKVSDLWDIGRIVLGKFTVRGGRRSILNHEFGHHYWYTHMRKRSEFRLYWESHRSEFREVSDYASMQDGAHEGWAEAFSVYVSPFYKEGMLSEGITALMKKFVGEPVMPPEIPVGTYIPPTKPEGGYDVVMNAIQKEFLGDEEADNLLKQVLDEVK